MSQPFDRFTIHSLRGIKNLELPGLGQVNLLVGGNDSGKTTVLEALALYCNPLDVVSWEFLSRQREPLAWFFSVVSPEDTRVDDLRWLFPQNATPGKDDAYEGRVFLSANGTFPVREVHAHYREIRGSPPRRQPLRPSIRYSAELQRERRGAEILLKAEPGFEPQVITLWEGERLEEARSALGPEVPFQLINPADHYLTSLAVQEFTEARLGGMQEAVKDLLRGFDPRIAGVEILAPRGQPTLYLQDSVAGLAPISAFGDGIRRALLFALALPRVAGGVLLIDEIETAIHVSALGKVFRWMLDACKQYSIQLFVTTHSLEAVDAILGADTTEAEDIVGFRLEPTAERTVAKRYGEDLLKRLRYERGLDVR
jgi:energy-coupling factor transporter ATP-binding protein EcfA2